MNFFISTGFLRTKRLKVVRNNRKLRIFWRWEVQLHKITITRIYMTKWPNPHVIFLYPLKTSEKRPWGTPNKVSFHKLNFELICVLYFLFDKWLCINRNIYKLDPYTLNLAIRRSCERQSKDFERSLRSAPNFCLSSVVNFYFSIIAKKRCWALNLFLKSQWYFDKIVSKYLDICLNPIRSYSFEIFDKTLTGL